MTEHRSPLDAALDLVVYAPLGLALTIGEELPRLAAKGRSTVSGRVQVARVVGQFAVAQGRTQVERRLRPEPPAAPQPPAAPRPASPTAATAATAPAGGAASRPAPTSAAPAAPAAPAAAAHDGAAAADGAAPDVDALAIPGYDSLSASQVVQRLAGLAPAELDAVRRYEAARRGRRTILARISQLHA